MDLDILEFNVYNMSTNCTKTINFKGVEMEVNFDYTPAEPMVRYYSDGSGYPGAAEELDICWVTIADMDWKDYLSDKCLDEISAQLSEEREE